MSTVREELRARIRRVVPAGGTVREVSMFGGIAIMLDDAILVSAGRDGSLLVRIDPEDHEVLRELPGARAAVMGQERPMGPGWITVDGDALGDDDALASWIAAALAFHAR